MLSSHPDAVAVRSPGRAQHLRPPRWPPAGLTAQLCSQEGSPSPMLAHRDNKEWKIMLKRPERSTAGKSTTCLQSRQPEQVGATPPLKGCLKPDQTIASEPRYHQSSLSEVSSSCLLLNVGSHIYFVASEGLDNGPLGISQTFSQPPLTKMHRMCILLEGNYFSVPSMAEGCKGFREAASGTWFPSVLPIPPTAVPPKLFGKWGNLRNSWRRWKMHRITMQNIELFLTLPQKRKFSSFTQLLFHLLFYYPSDILGDTWTFPGMAHYSNLKGRSSWEQLENLPPAE